MEDYSFWITFGLMLLLFFSIIFMIRNLKVYECRSRVNWEICQDIKKRGFPKNAHLYFGLYFKVVTYNQMMFKFWVWPVSQMFSLEDFWRFYREQIEKEEI